MTFVNYSASITQSKGRAPIRAEDTAALRGLQEVMARVFGVRMARAALEPGEGWAGGGERVGKDGLGPLGCKTMTPTAPRT